jgi:xylan 1,4-beta-xylosidase
VINTVPAKDILIHHYRVDNRFSNSFEEWKAMGKPQHVTASQYASLETSGHLQLLTSPYWMNVGDKKVRLKLELPRQGVSLIKLSW